MSREAHLIEALHDLLTRPTDPAARIRARAVFDEATVKAADPTPAIFVQFSDDGQFIRKWSFEPFEAGARYIPAFVPAWDNPDGPQAA